MLFFIIKEGASLKEIGERFKEKRKEIGISLKEVSNDLNVDDIILENLEEGNNKVFKDVLELKNTIAIYTKYLGLDEEEIMDEVNDYLYDKTSKIKIEDIKEELGKIVKTEEKKVRTPYTIERKKKTDYSILIICLVMVGLIVVFYFVLKKLYSI